MKITHITMEQAKAIYPLDLPGGCEEWLTLLNARIDKANPLQETYITAAQARALGAGNAEYQYSKNNAPWSTWITCGCGYEESDDSWKVKYRAIKQAQPENLEPLSSNFIQAVPDRCDRIVWRGNYYHLPLKAVTHQAQPEPSDPHAALRAEYAKQVKDGTVGFYLWEFQNTLGGSWKKTEAPNIPAFYEERQYRCTDIRV